MESSNLRETLSFLQDPCVRREGIQRYAARLKSGSPLPAFVGTSFARMTYTLGYSYY